MAKALTELGGPCYGTRTSLQIDFFFFFFFFFLFFSFFFFFFFILNLYGGFGGR